MGSGSIRGIENMNNHSTDFLKYERILSYLRLGFILVFCLMYLIYFVHDWDKLTIIFVYFTMALFTFNHFMYIHLQSIKLILLVALLDLLLASSYSFVFVHTNMPSQALIAGVGISLFYKIRSHRIMLVFFFLLMLYWIAFSYYEIYKGLSVNLVDIIVFTVFILYTTIMGSLLRNYQQSRNETVQLNKQLLQYSKKIEALATTRERNRIAREIHDSVGHNLTSLLIQLQAARKLRHIEPERSDTVLVKCEHLARSTLQDLRLSVRTMNEEEWTADSFAEMIKRLVDDFSNLSGMKIKRNIEGNFEGVESPILLSCFRIVQECLTNAKKHGNASRCNISLRKAQGLLHLEMQDDGGGTDHIEEGFGLHNMRERVEEHSGFIRFFSKRGEGFSISICIPFQN
jgi:signal transduction histidine kinase